MTDARISREHVEALILPSPDARLSRVQVEALVAPLPDAKIYREHVEVLYLSGTPSRTPYWTWV